MVPESPGGKEIRKCIQMHIQMYIYTHLVAAAEAEVFEQGRRADGTTVDRLSHVPHGQGGGDVFGKHGLVFGGAAVEWRSGDMAVGQEQRKYGINTAARIHAEPSQEEGQACQGGHAKGAWITLVKGEVNMWRVLRRSCGCDRRKGRGPSLPVRRRNHPMRVASSDGPPRMYRCIL